MSSSENNNQTARGDRQQNRFLSLENAKRILKTTVVLSALLLSIWAVVLNQALEQLPGRKVIFTNGSTAHAKNVTKKLGITHHFDATFDIVDCEFTPKPDLVVYKKMLSTFSINPKSAVMIEDMARNLVPAAALGITTVWVRTEEAWAVEGAGGDHIDHIVDDLTEWLNSIV